MASEYIEIGITMSLYDKTSPAFRRQDLALKKQQHELRKAQFEWRKLQATQRKANTTMSVSSQKLASMSRNAHILGITFGASAIAVGRWEVQLDKSVRRANTLIRDLSNNSRREIDNFAKTLGTGFGVGFESIAEGVYESLSAGLTRSNFARFVSDAMVLSMAETTDTATSVDFLTTVVQGMNMAWSDTPRIMNVASIAIDDGKITMDELNHSVATAIPFAQGLGLKYEDVAAGLSVMTLNGIKADEASTALRRLFISLQDPTKKLGLIFKKAFGDTVQEYVKNGGSLIEVLQKIDSLNMPIHKLFAAGADDVRARKGYDILISSASDMYDIQKRFNEEQDNTAKKFQEMADSAEAAWNRVGLAFKKNVIQGIGTSPGMIDAIGEITTPTWGALGAAGAGAAIGGTIGSILPGAGTLVGAGLGGAAGWIVGSLMGDDFKDPWADWKKNFSNFYTYGISGATDLMTTFQDLQHIMSFSNLNYDDARAQLNSFYAWAKREGFNVAEASREFSTLLTEELLSGRWDAYDDPDTDADEALAAAVRHVKRIMEYNRQNADFQNKYNSSVDDTNNKLETERDIMEEIRKEAERIKGILDDLAAGGWSDPFSTRALGAIGLRGVASAFAGGGSIDAAYMAAIAPLTAESLYPTTGTGRGSKDTYRSPMQQMLDSMFGTRDDKGRVTSLGSIREYENLTANMSSFEAEFGEAGKGLTDEALGIAESFAKLGVSYSELDPSIQKYIRTQDEVSDKIRQAELEKEQAIKAATHELNVFRSAAIQASHAISTDTGGTFDPVTGEFTATPTTRLHGQAASMYDKQQSMLREYKEYWLERKRAKAAGEEMPMLWGMTDYKEIKNYWHNWLGENRSARDELTMRGDAVLANRAAHQGVLGGWAAEDHTWALLEQGHRIETDAKGRRRFVTGSTIAQKEARLATLRGRESYVQRTATKEDDRRLEMAIARIEQAIANQKFELNQQINDDSPTTYSDLKFGKLETRLKRGLSICD